MATRQKTGGRKAGTPNKLTASIKDAFQEAFNGLGGAPALQAWGRENPTDFYKLASKLIPQDIKADLTSNGQTIQPVINVAISPKP